MQAGPIHGPRIASHLDGRRSARTAPSRHKLVDGSYLPPYHPAGHRTHPPPCHDNPRSRAASSVLAGRSGGGGWGGRPSGPVVDGSSMADPQPSLVPERWHLRARQGGHPTPRRQPRHCLTSPAARPLLPHHHSCHPRHSCHPPMLPTHATHPCHPPPMPPATLQNGLPHFATYPAFRSTLVVSNV